MTFNAQVNRLQSGVTLDAVHLRLARKVRDANIVDPSAVWMVLDDESIPQEHPPHDRFITVRLPSLIWAHGDVFIGGGNISKFIVQGQVRISLWLRNEADMYGQINVAMGEAVGAAPRGSKLLGQLVRLMWEDDLLDASGNAILMRPMMFVSYEPPSGGLQDWRPFRLTWELEFNWDLSVEDPETP